MQMLSTPLLLLPRHYTLGTVYLVIKALLSPYPAPLLTALGHHQAAQLIARSVQLAHSLVLALPLALLALARIQVHLAQALVLSVQLERIQSLQGRHYLQHVQQPALIIRHLPIAMLAHHRVYLVLLARPLSLQLLVVNHRYPQVSARLIAPFIFLDLSLICLLSL